MKLVFNTWIPINKQLIEMISKEYATADILLREKHNSNINEPTYDLSLYTLALITDKCDLISSFDGNKINPDNYEELMLLA